MKKLSAYSYPYTCNVYITLAADPSAFCRACSIAFTESPIEEDVCECEVLEGGVGAGVGVLAELEESEDVEVDEESGGNDGGLKEATGVSAADARCIKKNEKKIRRILKELTRYAASSR